MINISRIESSQNFIVKFKNSTKVLAFVRIIVLVIIFLFVLVQVLVMFLCYFDLVSLKVFFIEIIVFICALVLGLNINIIVLYFKLAGLPYKTNKHYLCVRKIGIVCTIWSIAFIIKLIVFGCGKSLF